MCFVLAAVAEDFWNTLMSPISLSQLMLYTGYEPADSPSGTSSHTATQMSAMAEGLEQIKFSPPQRYGSRDLGADLPIRRRQRKPDKRGKTFDFNDISSRVPKKKTPGRKPKMARSKSSAASLPLQERHVMPASPRAPLPPRELPARHTPKKMWQV